MIRPLDTMSVNIKKTSQQNDQILATPEKKILIAEHEMKINTGML